MMARRRPFRAVIETISTSGAATASCQLSLEAAKPNCRAMEEAGGSPAAALGVLTGAAVAAWFGLPVLAFAALVPAALAIEAGDAFGLLGRSIFSSKPTDSRLYFILRLIWDVVLVGIGALAIDGSRAHRLFAPLITGGLLHVPPSPPESGWRALAGDRGVLAALLALAAAVGLAEGGFMLLALLLVALRIAAPVRERG